MVRPDDFDVENWDPYASDADPTPDVERSDIDGEEEEPAPDEGIGLGDDDGGPSAEDADVVVDEDALEEQPNFGPVADDLHSDLIVRSKRANLAPFDLNNPREILDAIARAKMREGSIDDEDIVTRFYGYLTKNGRRIATRIKREFDWQQEQGDVRGHGWTAILRAIDDFEIDPGKSDADNMRSFWGLLGRVLQTMVKRPTVKETYRMSDGAAYERSDVLKARAAASASLGREASEAEIHARVILDVFQKNGDPALAEIALAFGVADIAQAPLDRVAEHLFHEVLPARLVGRMFPDFVPGDIRSDRAIRRSLLSRIVRGTYNGADDRARSLSDVLLAERFGQANPDDPADVTNAWIEGVHGWGGERHLPAALRATLEEEGGLASVDLPGRPKEESIFILAAAIMRHRYGAEADPIASMRAELARWLLRLELVRLFPEGVRSASLGEVARRAVECEAFARLAKRPRERDVRDRLVTGIADVASADKLRDLLLHSAEEVAIDAPIGGEDGPTHAEVLEGAVALVGDVDLSPEEQAMLDAIGRAADRTVTHGANDHLKRQQFCLRIGRSLLPGGRSGLHREHSASEIALFGGYTRASALNHTEFENAVLGYDVPVRRMVPATGPDGREYLVEREVRGTLFPNRRKSIEQARRIR